MQPEPSITTTTSQQQQHQQPQQQPPQPLPPPSSSATPAGPSVRRKEIYTFKAPWPIYGLHWSPRADRPFRLGFGSFLEEYTNKIQVIQLNDAKGDFVKIAETDHSYPCTKLMWMPYKAGKSPDLLATTGDYLRIWEIVDDSKIKMKCLLANNKAQDFCAPLTSFDWNETDPNIIATSSIDTTCTIWNIETQQPKTQLIAHDKEVYDVAFARGVDIFASVGADGSVRMFDLRSLEHSTIIYETPDTIPLLRLTWNKQDPNYLATFQLDSAKVIILDIRVPSIPVTELHGHNASINACVWAPHSSAHMCTAGDDSQALVWDVTQMRKYIQDPILAYNADSEINQMTWSASQTDWVAISFNDTIQALRV